VATNRDLEKMMENREFRSDLYYRLNVFPIRIPPLRERPGDIPLLVRYFTQKYGRRMQRQIESALLPVFMSNRNLSYSCVNESRGQDRLPCDLAGLSLHFKIISRRSSERLFVTHPDRLPEILMKSRHGLFIFRL
jgi:hypothetical protein